MNSELKSILLQREKTKMVHFLKTNPQHFDEAIKVGITNEQPFSWRAAWMVVGVMKKNDPRLTPYLSEIIAKLPDFEDGHQRELLKILLKMKLTEEQESLLFDLSVTLWEQVLKKPSVRHFAFRCMLKVAQKYPELENEILLLAQPHYVNPLSPGIRNSVLKAVSKLKNKN